MENLQIKLRKYENQLIMTGIGVVIFGLWSVIRTVLSVIFETGYILSSAGMDTDITSELFKLLIIAVFVLLLIDLAIRVFIWRSANSLGKRRKNKNAYIVFAFIEILFSAYSIYTTISNYAYVNDLIETAVSMIVEITSLVILIELIVASFKLKSVKKQITHFEENK